MSLQSLPVTLVIAPLLGVIRPKYVGNIYYDVWLLILQQVINAVWFIEVFLRGWADHSVSLSSCWFTFPVAGG